MPAPLAPLIAARHARPPRPLWDRFWAKVDMRAGLTGCWIWRGATTEKRKGCGHKRGVIQLAGRGSSLLLAHRVALCFAGEGIEAEYYDTSREAAHRCGNRLCCNSYSHLYWATAHENREDRAWEQHRALCDLYFSRYEIAYDHGADPDHLEYLARLESL